MKNWIANIATDGEVEFIMEKVADLLEEHGVRIDHEEVSAILEKAGATQGPDGRTRFPKKLQAEALAAAPREFLVAGAEEKYDVPIPHPEGSFYAQGPIGQMFYLDPLTNERRECTMADQEDYIKVQQALEGINFWGNFTAKVDGFPVQTLDLHTAALCFTHCAKPGTWMIYNESSIPYGIEMAEVIAGGAKAHSERPLFALESASASPMGLNHMDAEMILQSARRKIPLICASLPTAGANAPITPEGVAFLAVAEGIYQVIIAQLIQPGAPAFIGSLHLTMDMKTMATISPTIELMRSMMLSVQTIERGYHLPTRTLGGSANAHTLDMQAIAEEAIASQLMAVAGGTLLDNFGTYDNWNTASPLQLIIDNDLIAMAKSLKSGVTVDLERIGYEAIRDFKTGTAFLNTPHTLRHFKEVLQPKTFVRTTLTDWESKGGRNMIDLAREQYKKIIEKHQPVAHAPEVVKELNDIVSRADREFS
ncbi:trimethylamine methyltransferase family protein [Clostridia bacterium OttesenSCG-928-O13]|nr:trimethylamine methyltransferase family protein [Clostridia bacterium OttesenSCG-928-O13]